MSRFRLTKPHRLPLGGTVGVSGQVSATVPVQEWTVGAVSLQQGSSTPFDVAATGPSNVTAGGVYRTDPSGPNLPTGMQLSEAGSLAVGSATATTQTGVVFTYHEPGALPTLTLHGTGTNVPYMATVYPLEGAIPAGQVIRSPDEPNLRCSILSTWPDGSAQVAVVAGSTSLGGTLPISLRPGVSTGEGNLTTAAINAVVTRIEVNFTGTTQQLLLSAATPDWIWWANSQVICARYRLPITGKGSMEAVIDIHAFAGGRAFVEVVIENGKVNASGTLNQYSLTAQTYTNATVAVNGTTIATVSSPSVGMAPVRSNARGGGYTWAGGHGVGRAWYCAAEIASGVVTPKTADTHYALFGLEVTHDTASLQAHPLGFKPVVASAQTMATKYEQTYDRYEPWSTGRLRVPIMNAGGDDEELTCYTETQANYIITGDKVVRRALLAHGLSLLSMTFNWRHTDGRLPTLAQMTGKTFKNTAYTWPMDGNEPAYGHTGPLQDPTTSHIPFLGVYHFLCRPSPCFIEVAQKDFCWQVLGAGVYLNDVVHWEERLLSQGERSMHNGIRNYMAAAFVTPSVGPDATASAARKADIASAIYAWTCEAKAYQDKAWNTLGIIYNGQCPTDAAPYNYNKPYQMWYGAQNFQLVAAAKPLSGDQATTLNTVAGKIVNFQSKFITDASAGEWRAVLYDQYVGEPSGNYIDMGVGNWAERNRLPFIAGSDSKKSLAEGGQRMTFGPDVPSAKGPLLNGWSDGTNGSWAALSPLVGTMDYNPGSTGYYPALYWDALVAGVEMGSSDAEAAWSKVMGSSTRTSWDAGAGITNLSEFLTPFGTAPRFNRWPRNKA